MSAPVADLLARLRLDSTQFTSGMTKAQASVRATESATKSASGGIGRSLTSVDSKAQSFANKMKNMGAGVLAAAAVVGAGLRMMINEAEEAQQVGRQTDAVIASTGGVANVTATGLARLAQRLSGVAAVDDEVIQSAGNVLLTFKAVHNQVGKGNDIFDRAITAALDLSAALGTSLQGATLQLGKALANPVQGMTQLRRAGVDFTEQQKEQVAAMVAVGDTLGAQKLILAEVESQFGGSAAANATASAKMGVAVKNMAETFGTLLLPVLTLVATALTGIGTAINAVPTPILVAVAAMAAMYFAAPILSAALDFVAISAYNAAGGLGTMTVASISAKIATMGLGAQLGLVAGVMTFGYYVLKDYVESLGEAGATTEQAASASINLMNALASTGSATDAVAANVDALYASGNDLSTMLRQAGISASDFHQTLMTTDPTSMGGKIMQMAQAVEAAGGSYSEAQFAIDAFADSQQQAARAAIQAAVDAGNLDPALSSAAIGATGATVATRNYVSALATLQAQNPDAFSELGDSAATAAGQVEELKTALDEYLASSFNVPAAQRAVRASFEEVFSTLLTEGHSLDDVNAALQGTVESTAALVQAQAENGESARNQIVTIDLSILKLREQRDAGLISAEQFREYNRVLQNMKPVVSTDVRTPGLTSATALAEKHRRVLEGTPYAVATNASVRVIRDAFDQLVRDLEASEVRRFTMQVSVNRPPGAATGTTNAPEGLMWVGERGPELMSMAGGERVYTHTQSMAMADRAASSGPTRGATQGADGNVTLLMVTPEGALRRLPRSARPQARRFLAGDN